MNYLKILRLAVIASLAVFGAACIQYTLSPEQTGAAKDGLVQVQVGLDHCLQMNVLTKTRSLCMGTDKVFGMGFDLDYDPAILEFQSLDLAGGAIHDSTAVTAFRNSAVDNGHLVVGISKLGQVPGEPVQGMVATITFKAKAAGVSKLTFRDPQLLDNAGKYYVGWPFYSATLQKAQVTVSP